jgi:hypothetical protein
LFFWYFNPPERISTGNTPEEAKSHTRSIEIGKKIGKILYERIGYYIELKPEYVNRPCMDVIYELSLSSAMNT